MTLKDLYKEKTIGELDKKDEDKFLSKEEVAE